MKFLKRWYDKVLSWADSPYSEWALFLNAFAESSFFPIPPDVLMMAMEVGKPKKSFRFATISSIGSILGGIAGYGIGYFLFDTIGRPIIKFYHLTDKFQHLGELYNTYSAWIVSIAGFTPIPYKLITITSGFWKINFLIFLIASALSRSARFFIISTLFYFFGAKIKDFIDKYFNLLSILFFILLIAGFAIIKLIK